MTLIQKLIMLDRRLSLRRATPVVPVVTAPTPAEIACREAIHHDARHHARVIEAAGVRRA